MISAALFELLCIQAKAGRSIDLARANLLPTLEQAETLMTLMSGGGVLSLRKHGFDVTQLVALRLSGCKWVDDLSDRPLTPCPDGLDFS
jgi:hypothetical protein